MGSTFIINICLSQFEQGITAAISRDKKQDWKRVSTTIVYQLYFQYGQRNGQKGVTFPININTTIYYKEHMHIPNKNTCKSVSTHILIILTRYTMNSPMPS